MQIVEKTLIIWSRFAHCSHLSKTRCWHLAGVCAAEEKHRHAKERSPLLAHVVCGRLTIYGRRFPFRMSIVAVLFALLDGNFDRNRRPLHNNAAGTSALSVNLHGWFLPGTWPVFAQHTRKRSRAKEGSPSRAHVFCGRPIVYCRSFSLRMRTAALLCVWLGGNFHYGRGLLHSEVAGTFALIVDSHILTGVKSLKHCFGCEVVHAH